MTAREQAIRTIEAATDPACIFPAGPNSVAAYRRLLALIHPDRFPPADRPRAEAAAQKLADFFSRVGGRPVAAPVVIGKWVVEGPFAKGDIADLHLISSDSGEGILKIARSAADNDLMAGEHNALTTLRKRYPGNFLKYLPQPLDFFQASGRRAIVLARHPGYLSLEEIRAQLGSVPFRHAVWMMNRLLSVLGFIHGAGFVHGGITPDHLLYHPETHGLILVGWCSAVMPDGAHVPIMADRWKPLYPAEVARRVRAHPATDICMAARSILYAVDQVPDRFRSLFEWCAAPSVHARPDSAWGLQDDWMALAAQQYGKPAYQKLVLPTN